jgi:hypothetical protein
MNQYYTHLHPINKKTILTPDYTYSLPYPVVMRNRVIQSTHDVFCRQPPWIRTPSSSTANFNEAINHDSARFMDSGTTRQTLAGFGRCGHLPWLLNDLDDEGETFLAEIHADQ